LATRGGICVEHDTLRKPLGANPMTGCAANAARVEEDPVHWFEAPCAGIVAITSKAAT